MIAAGPAILGAVDCPPERRNRGRRGAPGNVPRIWPCRTQEIREGTS